MTQIRTKIIEVFGWYGVVAILSAYTLLNLGVIELRSVGYQILNLTGALAIMIDAHKDKNYQPVALNVVWFAIAAFGLISLAI